jgi:phage-related baseplate assembly protein
LSAVQNKDIPVPSGTRGTPDGTLYFTSSKDIVIPAGSLYADILAYAVDAGEKYNGFVAGQIKTLVDPIPYVASVANIDTSAGGADTEADDDGVNVWSGYRERIREAPEAISVAGPEGAYKYLAKAVDVNIADVSVTSPSAGVVKITVLMKSGALPSQDILDKVLAKCSSRDRRPLTDNVQAAAPTTVSYDIKLTYYLDKEHSAEELNYRKTIEGEKLDCSTGAIKDYVNWLQEKLGRAINPDDLRYRIQNTASYKDNYNVSYTAVRRITMDSPALTVLKETEVAKVGTITITYGGLE